MTLLVPILVAPALAALACLLMRSRRLMEWLNVLAFAVTVALGVRLLGCVLASQVVTECGEFFRAGSWRSLWSRRCLRRVWVGRGRRDGGSRWHLGRDNDLAQAYLFRTLHVGAAIATAAVLRAWTRRQAATRAAGIWVIGNGSADRALRECVTTPSRARVSRFGDMNAVIAALEEFEVPLAVEELIVVLQSGDLKGVEKLAASLDRLPLRATIAVEGLPVESAAATSSFVLFSTGPNSQGGGKRTTKGHYDVPMRDCTVALDNDVIIVMELPAQPPIDTVT